MIQSINEDTLKKLYSFLIETFYFIFDLLTGKYSLICIKTLNMQNHLNSDKICKNMQYIRFLD